MRKIIFLALLSSSRILAQQVNTGIISDNYVSSNLATYNPSSIVDSKTKIAFTTNMDYTAISNFYARNYLVYGPLGAKYLEPKKSGYLNRYASSDLLNFKLEINHKNAIGYSFKYKMIDIKSGIPLLWSENVTSNYLNNTPGSVNFEGMRFSKLNYTEHAFTYARTIFDKQLQFLKAGATFKILNGLDAKYFQPNSGTASFSTNPTDLVVSDLGGEFGTAMTYSQQFYKNRGIGFDIGFTYEYRPNYERQYYEMDGVKDIIRYDINKYKWKVAGSITDIGHINFINDTASYNFSNASINSVPVKIVDLTTLFNGPFNALNTIQKNGTKDVTQDAKFKMILPTTMHLSFDYNIKNNYYVAYNASIPLVASIDSRTISTYFIQTITPRLEKENFSIMIPISQMGNQKFYGGLAARFKGNNLSIFGGSNNLAILYGQKSSLTRNFFVGLTIDIKYTTPLDRDFDKVSDEKDNCPYDKGLLEFNGCPDTDGDGIIDKEDNCIYDKGPRNTNGCPDTDGDGIIDMNDMCPDVKGLGVHYGCPDRDFDGVIDAADKCPDVPGIELNNGCPFENPGCCMDDDGDGVSNRVDKCPDFAGSVYNYGCPIDSVNINTINLKEQKVAIDPNNTEHEIQRVEKSDSIQVPDGRQGLITSPQELKTLLDSKNITDDYTVFFDVDQATLNDVEQTNFDNFFSQVKNFETISLMIIGYTDRDGSLDYNLILSKKRAETIKRKLIQYGFAPDRIAMYYYGETKSLHKGSYTDELKKSDRKVEIKIVKK